MNAVDTWCVQLDVPPGDFYPTLTDEERDRSARLRFPHDRRRFIVAHGVLRGLLGCYVGVRPEELRFVRGQFGKPRLSPAFDCRIRFSLSHSADVALIAVARDAEVGVDVEHVRSLPELTEDPHAFLRGWTKNEAYAKATGRGLANEAAPDGRGRWSFFSLHPAPGYVGALVIEGDRWRLRHHTYFPNRSNRYASSGPLSVSYASLAISRVNGSV